MLERLSGVVKEFRERLVAPVPDLGALKEIRRVHDLHDSLVAHGIRELAKENDLDRLRQYGENEGQQWRQQLAEIVSRFTKSST